MGRGFQTALLESVQGSRKPFTFAFDGLGYVRVKDEVVGKPRFISRLQYVLKRKIHR